MNEKPLYLITDGGKLREEGTLVEKVQQALIGAKGKVAYVQLREHPIHDDVTKELATKLGDVCRVHGAKLIVNSRVDIASFFDGAHLKSKQKAEIKIAKKEIGDDKVIGYSAHSVEEAKEVLDLGVDYVFLSPIYAPISKDNSSEPLGLDSIKELREKTDKTFFALGGIDLSNANACLNAGASGVACLSSILLAEYPKKEATKFVNNLTT